MAHVDSQMVCRFPQRSRRHQVCLSPAEPGRRAPAPFPERGIRLHFESLLSSLCIPLWRSINPLWPKPEPSSWHIRNPLRTRERYTPDGRKFTYDAYAHIQFIRWLTKSSASPSNKCLIYTCGRLPLT
jgi:hypothetical protein